MKKVYYSKAFYWIAKLNKEIAKREEKKSNKLK
jgi:hypothetical protein